MRRCALLAVFLLIGFLLFRAMAQDNAAGLRAFTGARILNGVSAAPIENGVLLVRDGRIEAVGAASATAIPAGAEIVDLAGRTIAPGLINAHGHVTGNVEDRLRLFARYGVTTVVSLGGENAEHIAVRDRQDRPDLDHARIFVAGPVIGGASPAAAIQSVDQTAALNVDWIKIRVDDNLGATAKMEEPIYGAIIERTHSRGLKLAAHMFYLDDAKRLLRRGADLLAHSVRDTDVDAELIALLRDNGICVTPTLTREVSAFVYDSRPDFFDDPFFRREVDEALMQQALGSNSNPAYRDALAVAQRNLKAFRDAGVRIALGTDSGAAANRFPGYFEHLEMELMADAGLTPAEILRSASIEAARCMGLAANLGSLEPGKWADFIVLAADPLADIRNSKTLESVWIAGNRVPARP